MAHRRQHSHVPKFGNWEETDNIPYTAYFENARREKGGFMMMNPNDPMENPEAFNMCKGGYQNETSLEKRSHETVRNHTRRHVHPRSRGSPGSFTAESATERSHSDHSVIHRSPQSDHKRSMSKGGSIISGFSSSSHNRHRSGSHSFNDPHTDHQATTIPKFGTWDVTDPKSGDGYTAIFSKIKEEKQIASSHIPSISTPPLNNGSNIKNQCEGHSLRLSKYCCCLFSSGPQETLNS